MKKLLLILLTFLLTPFPLLLAQETETTPETETTSEYQTPEPRIDVRPSFRVGESIFIDGSASVNPNPDYPLSYSWEMGDGSTSTAKNFQYIYSNPGTYDITLTLRQTITELDENGQRQTKTLEASTTTPVYVYRATAFLIYDDSLTASRREQLFTNARSDDFHFSTIDATKEAQGLSAEDTLIRNLRESLPALRSSNIIFVWSDSVSTLNALTRFYLQNTTNIDFSQKTIALVTDHNMTTARRISQGTFLALQPEQILFLRPPAIDEVITAEGDPTAFLTTVRSRGYDYSVLDSRTQHVALWNFMSQTIGHMISQGISHQTILYLLMLPVIVTIIAFCRQVIGFATGGIYAPAILTISFLFIGLPTGLATLIIIIAASLIARAIFRRRRLLFTPKIAFTVSLVALALFAALALTSAYLPARAATLSILPILILATLAEKITILDTGKSIRDVTMFFAEITLVSLIAYLIVGWWSGFQTFIFAYPEIIFLFVFANYLLGRWTGLRFFEYFRFRALIRELVSKEEE